METRNPSISPLRQRMIDDMRMRKFGEKTQLDYVRAARNFTKYLGRSPDTASVEELYNKAIRINWIGIVMKPKDFRKLSSVLKELTQHQRQFLIDRLQPTAQASAPAQLVETRLAEKPVCPHCAHE